MPRRLRTLLFAGALLNIPFICAAKAAAIDPHWAGLLRQLVSINSSTDNTAGLEKCRALLVPEFKRLGFQSTVLKLPNGRQVLSFEMPGAKPEILLVGHLDTVFKPAGSFNALREENERWIGPGVIDMKGGLVLMLNALARLGDPSLLRRVRILVNDDEEIGSSFSKDKLRELAQGIPVVLVYEPGTSDGSVVGSASGVRWIKMDVEGAAAHAGLEHEKGLNACVELAAKSVEISKLTDYRRRLTLNVGVIGGGAKPNIVCSHASATIDLRFVNPEDLAETMKTIESIRDRAYAPNGLSHAAAKASIQIVAEMPSLPSSASAGLVRLIERISAGEAIPTRAVHVGYGSDGNHLVEPGRQVLVGLGPTGGGMHTEQEYMELGSYQRRLELSLKLIRSLLTDKEKPAHG